MKMMITKMNYRFNMNDKDKMIKILDMIFSIADEDNNEQPNTNQNDTRNN